MLIKFFAFAMMGMCIQLVIVAVLKSVSSAKLVTSGEASVIMLPIYGMIGIIYPAIAVHLGYMNWYWRGIVYVISFYTFQYVFGIVLTKLKICPWRYSGSWTFNGVVRIHDAPLWFACGFIIEYVYPYVKLVVG